MRALLAIAALLAAVALAAPTAAQYGGCDLHRAAELLAAADDVCGPGGCPAAAEPAPVPDLADCPCGAACDCAACDADCPCRAKTAAPSVALERSIVARRARLQLRPCQPLRNLARLTVRGGAQMVRAAVVRPARFFAAHRPLRRGLAAVFRRGARALAFPVRAARAVRAARFAHRRGN